MGEIHWKESRKGGIIMNIDFKTEIDTLLAYVESESKEGMYYKVTKINGNWACTCPQNQKRKLICKHIKAVEAEE